MHATTLAHNLYSLNRSCLSGCHSGSLTVHTAHISKQIERGLITQDGSGRTHTDDVSGLRYIIVVFFEAAMVEDVLVLPYAKQGLIGEVYDSGQVLSEEYDETGRVLTVCGLPGAIARLRRSIAVH